ncbi:alternative ribosome rescue aminoacyl-tRNA hydrolase ArfB [Aquisalimonas sp.]|uniref:alternative ribosome rescue aminoacyl-tRNA hydrolase ArfB n=1 Tax=Aquisalimonas sp. TaxID=1872621 RepID=UPI0025B8AF1A|nr:alternative ribosome rescue aminoacyl-tRNA hydrolase ArfB [Aquisalimonas sp.]
MLRITPSIAIPLDEIQLDAVRAQGPGGQHVNKAATAVHLRFDIQASSLPDEVKQRLGDSNDQRITRDGVIVLKAQKYRSLNRNREEALARLRELIHGATLVPRKRKPTGPSRGAKRRRLESKKRRGQTKTLRRGPGPAE